MKEFEKIKAENNQFVEMIERDAFERNIPFKEAFCNRNRQLIVEELEKIKAEMLTDLYENRVTKEALIKIVSNRIAELKGESNEI